MPDRQAVYRPINRYVLPGGSDGHGGPAPGTVQGSSLKFFKTRIRFFHTRIIKKKKGIDKPQESVSWSSLFRKAISIGLFLPYSIWDVMSFERGEK
jgi:hypothetical protein